MAAAAAAAAAAVAAAGAWWTMASWTRLMRGACLALRGVLGFSPLPLIISPDPFRCRLSISHPFAPSLPPSLLPSLPPSLPPLSFRELDTDGSGQLTKEDFIEAVAEPERKAMLREMTRKATLKKTTQTPPPEMSRSVTKVGFGSPVQVQG